MILHHADFVNDQNISLSVESVIYHSAHGPFQQFIQWHLQAIRCNACICKDCLTTDINRSATRWCHNLDLLAHVLEPRHDGPKDSRFTATRRASVEDICAAHDQLSQLLLLSAQLRLGPRLSGCLFSAFLRRSFRFAGCVVFLRWSFVFARLLALPRFVSGTALTRRQLWDHRQDMLALISNSSEQ
jgi:hypothetical protein